MHATDDMMPRRQAEWVPSEMRFDLPFVRHDTSHRQVEPTRGHRGISVRTPLNGSKGGDTISFSRETWKSLEKPGNIC